MKKSNKFSPRCANVLCAWFWSTAASTHHWARQLQRLGYTVKLIAPQFVKPYVKSNKNDANDAEAICEAMSRPNMRFVAIKSVEQQDIQAVHRIRSELSSQRTAKANQIRGLCAEYGLAAPKELLQLRAAIPCWLEDQGNGLTERFRRLLTGLWHDLLGLDERIKELDREITLIAQTDPVAKRLQQLRGVGPIIATAIVANVGDAKQFANGRQMAASIGLTPKHRRYMNVQGIRILLYLCSDTSSHHDWKAVRCMSTARCMLTRKNPERPVATIAFIA